MGLITYVLIKQKRFTTNYNLLKQSEDIVNEMEMQDTSQRILVFRRPQSKNIPIIWSARPTSKKFPTSIADLNDNICYDSLMLEIQSNYPEINKNFHKLPEYCYISFKHRHWFKFDNNKNKAAGGYIKTSYAADTVRIKLSVYALSLKEMLEHN